MMIARVRRILDLEPYDEQLRTLVKKWAHLERDVMSVPNAMAHIYTVLHQGGFLFLDIEEGETGIEVHGYFLAAISQEPGRILQILQQYTDRKNSEKESVYSAIDEILLEEAKENGIGSIAYVSIRAVKDEHGSNRFFEKRGYKRAAAVFTRDVESEVVA